MKPIKDFDPSIPLASGALDTQGVNKGEQLMLYNDSLYGLHLTFTDGSVDIIPPSWSKDFIIENEPMGIVEWKVYNSIPSINYPISQVYGTIYEPGEHVARVNAGMQRGFQITGGAVVSGVTNTLTNENNPINTLIIDGGPTGNLNVIQVWNDHFIWSVVQAGVAHQVLKGNISGTPLQIGQALDLTEVLGNLQVSGFITTANGNNIQATGQLNSVVGIVALASKFFLDGSGANLSLLVPNGANIQFQINGVQKGGIDVSGWWGNLNYGAGGGASIGEGGGASNGFILGRSAGASTPVIASYSGSGGIGFKVGGIGGTKVFESKANRDFIIQGGTYWTNQPTFNFTASGSFDAFDYAEMFPVASDYFDGCVVCPGNDGLMHICTHWNCDRASIISLNPGYCAGNMDSNGVPSLPIALTGRKRVHCNFVVEVGEQLCSAGTGSVIPAKIIRGQVNSLGFALTETVNNTIGMMIRYQQMKGGGD